MGLVISEEEIREAFRVKAAVAHPDSGGEEAQFAALREAQEVLLSPAKRLREWLGVKGAPLDERGTIGAELMDFFQKVAEVGARAEAAVKASELAQTALAKGMAEVRLIAEQESVKGLLEEIEAGIAARVMIFPAIEKGECEAATAARDLVFLEKWRSAMRALYGRFAFRGV